MPITRAGLCGPMAAHAITDKAPAAPDLGWCALTGVSAQSGGGDIEDME